MSVEFVISGLIAIGLLLYLGYALFWVYSGLLLYYSSYRPRRDSA